MNHSASEGEPSFTWRRVEEDSSWVHGSPSVRSSICPSFSGTRTFPRFLRLLLLSLAKADYCRSLYLVVVMMVQYSGQLGYVFLYHPSPLPPVCALIRDFALKFSHLAEILCNCEGGGGGRGGLQTAAAKEWSAQAVPYVVGQSGPSRLLCGRT